MYKLQITHSQSTLAYNNFDKGVDVLRDEYATYESAWQAMSSYIQLHEHNWSTKFNPETEEVDDSILVDTAGGNEEYDVNDQIISVGDYNIEIINV